MKGAIYVRVSTEQQLDNFSITAQLKQIREYCLKNGIEIYKEYIDEGYSGTKENRPAFKEMINESDKFDIVLVHKYDRFARSIELSNRIENQLKQNNVAVISITEPIEDSPVGFLNRNLLSIMSEFYIKNLSREVKKGLNERIEQGLPCCKPVLGYKIIDKKLVVVEEQAKVVKLIFDLYIQGLGVQKIVNYLEENRVWNDKKIFNFNKVIRILKNPIYTGRFLYNGNLYDGQHESIIDLKVFESIQAEINKKGKNNVGRRNKRYYEYWLLSLFYCGECGGNMRIKHSGNLKISYYCCSTADRWTNKNKCNFTKMFRQNIFEKEFEDILYDFTNDLVVIPARVENTDTKKEILKNNLNKVTECLKKIPDLVLNDLLTIEQAKIKKSELTQEKNQLELELKNLHENVFDINKQKKKMLSIWEQFKYEKDICKKRELIKNIISKIYIYKSGELEIIFKEF